MTDEAYDAQTLATSARIERLHEMRFGRQLRTWTCPQGHVNHETALRDCVAWNCVRARVGGKYRDLPARFGDGGCDRSHPYPFYALSDPEELIYSRAN